MSNHLTLSDLDANAAVIKEAPIDQLEMLIEELGTLQSKAKQYSAIISGEMERRFAADADTARRDAGKDTGTVRLKSGEYVIVADLSKKIEWNQKEMKKAVAVVETWEGEPVSDYVDIEYSISERKFTAWPQTVRKVFEAARTVKTGKQSFKIEVAKD